MRRVGVKRGSSADVGSWDLPPTKRARVETSQGRGAALWMRITTRVGGIITSVKRWFHRTNNSDPQMSEGQTPSPSHASSSSSSCPPLMSPPSPPHIPSPPPLPLTELVSPAYSTRSQCTPHNTHSTTTTHPALSTATHQHTNTLHPPHTPRSTHHNLPSTRTTHYTGTDRLWSKSGKASLLHEVQRTRQRDHTCTTASPTSPLFSLSCTPPPASSGPSSPPPPASSGPPSPPPPASSGPISPGTAENIGPKLREQLFSSLHTSATPSSSNQPHSIPIRLRPTPVVPVPVNICSTPSTASILQSKPLRLVPPSLPHSPPLSPQPPISSALSHVIQRRKWVESVKADHTNSLTQHREAVERELSWLAQCRQSRFRAEDSRVRHLQDSVRNMSLLSDFSLDDSEGEEEEMGTLSEAQEQKVQAVLAGGSGLEVLSQRFNISIKRADIRTLGGLNWLNDEVINFYMNLIMERGKREQSVCRVHAMSSFFYPKLCDVGYSGVRRWTKKVDIFSMDLVLYPIHLGTHWCLAAINNNQHTLSYYDSLGGRGMSCLAALREYLVAEHRDKKKAELSLEGWRDVSPEDIPIQRNGSDCGVFTCMYARYLASNAPFTFTQGDMPRIRQHIICELLEQRLF